MPLEPMGSDGSDACEHKWKHTTMLQPLLRFEI